MKQTFSSAATSINAGKLPRVYRNISPAPNSMLFDYGCGKYTDHIAAALPSVTYLPYDPFNKPASVNQSPMYRLRQAMEAGTPVTVVCSNVMNVIDDDDTLHSIAKNIMRVIMRTGGTGYVTVYTGDSSGTGRQTGPDQYQRNEPLRNYLRFFKARIESGPYNGIRRVYATMEHGMIIIRREITE